MCGEYFNTSDEEARSSATLYYIDAVTLVQNPT